MKVFILGITLGVMVSALIAFGIRKVIEVCS